MFVRVGAQWTQQAKLTASNAEVAGRFGHPVSTSGERVLLGAYGVDPAGAAYVFARQGATWSEEAILVAAGAGPYESYGGTVALQGDRAVVGAVEDSLGVLDSGAAYVFERQGGAWVEALELRASAPEPYAHFGWPAWNDDELFIGAPGTSVAAEDAGAIHVYLIDPPAGSSYCAGDGSGAACPCANPGAAGEGCANSTGAGARLEGLGSASVSADDLWLVTTGLPPAQFGLVFQGEAAVEAPFGDDLRCVASDTGGPYRYAPSSSGAAGSAVLGPGIAALSAQLFGGGGTIDAGDTWNYQAWYRDPLGPCGGGFNLSNAVTVSWLP